MTAVRITGMASGLPPNIVEQMMEAERIPIKTMEQKKNGEDEKLKLVSELETKVTDITKNLSELLSVKGFSDTKLISGDANIVDGTVDPDQAVTGDYSLEVMQLAQKASAISNGFPDKNSTQIGVGYLRFDTPEGQKEIYINDKNSTLEGVANSITKANVGLKASVIEDRKDKENPFRLVVSGVGTGDGKQIVFPKIYMMDGDQDLYFDESKPSQNAKIKIDGFEIEVPENTVKDLFPGVTLNLKSASGGREVKVSVKENTEAIGVKIKGFVDSFNTALAFIQNQHKLGRDKSGRDSLGPLGGDSLLRSVESRLRGVVQSAQETGSPIRLLNQVGIEFTRNGTLNLTQEKFNKALSSDPAAMATFLKGDGFSYGFIPSVKRAVSDMTTIGYGVINNRKKGLKDKIESMNKRIDDKEKQLVKKEESLRNKFASLESKMSALQSQGGAVRAMAAGTGGGQ